MGLPYFFYLTWSARHVYRMQYKICDVIHTFTVNSKKMGEQTYNRVSGPRSHHHNPINYVETITNYASFYRLSNKRTLFAYVRGEPHISNYVRKRESDLDCSSSSAQIHHVGNSCHMYIF